MDRDNQRILADEPVANASTPRPGPAVPGTAQTHSSDTGDEGEPSVDPLAESGVTFFEGGDGREAAQGDIERDG